MTKPVAYSIYALIVILTGIGLGIIGLPFATLAFIAIFVSTPALFSADIRELRLPNAITLPLIAIGIVALLADQIVHPNLDIVFSVLIAIGLSSFLFIVSIFGGMGMGDVKLSLALLLCAANLGPAFPIIAISSAFLVAFCFCILIFVGLFRFFKNSGRISCLPFGPFLLLGFWTTVIVWGIDRWTDVDILRIIW